MSVVWLPLCFHGSFNCILLFQWLESQHTIRPGSGLVHFGLHGFLRNVSWPGRGGREAAQNIQLLLKEKSKPHCCNFLMNTWRSMIENVGVLYVQTVTQNALKRNIILKVGLFLYSLSFVLTGGIVCSSCHQEGSRTHGNVPSSHKKLAEREEPRYV